MASRYRMAAILVFSLLISVCSSCNVDDVAVYKVKLNVLWDDEMFPDEYKMDKGHWSPVFGQSHNKSYALYRIGEVSRPLLQDLVQPEALDHLVEEGDEDPKVYDQFSADVESGAAESMAFVDGTHSLVSLITVMIPPPHWLIGVDSLDLCVDSSWVDQVTLDLEPLDVGGNSFDGEAPEPVKKVTHFNTDFSFHHRKLRKLPPIGKVEFTKIKEYSTKELNDLARKELASKLIKLKQKDLFNGVLKQRALQDDMFLKEEKTKNNLDPLRDLEEEPLGTPKPNNPENNVIVVRKHTTEEPQQAEFGNLQNMDDVVMAVANGKKMGLGQHLPRHFRSRLHHAVNRKQDRDCKVSDWSDWSGCSDPCGSGVMVRIRSVTQKKKGNGHNCPSLIEKKPCGHKCRGDGDYVW